jgi:hypothetical protein
MHFPKFWIRIEERRGDLSTVMTGWSDSSREDAQNCAKSRAENVLERLSRGATSEELERYAYGERTPLREEIVEERDSGRDSHAIVTRNRYGALVLNSERVMFIDIDDADHEVGYSGGFFGFLFGRKPDPAARRNAIQQLILEAIDTVPDLRCVLYRTKAGFRVLVLSKLFDPKSEEALDVLRKFGSDSLYVTLTKNQKCFRARLSPKPWRCGIGKPPSEFPRETPEDADRFARWLVAYNGASRGFSVCETVGEFGRGKPLPAALAVRYIHDSMSISRGRPLA